MTILSKTVMAAIGAVAITRENAEKLIDELIRRGELDKSKRAEAVKEAVERAETAAKETVQKVKESKAAARAKETAHKVFESVSATAKELRDQAARLRPASAEDVGELRKTIAALEAQLEELKAKIN